MKSMFFNNIYMIKRKHLNKIVATVCIIATLIVFCILLIQEIGTHPSTSDAMWFSIGLGVITGPMVCVFIELFNSNR